MFWVPRQSVLTATLDKERGLVDRALGRAAFVPDLAKGPVEPFGTLKAVLASISGFYAQHQVRVYALFKALL